MKIGNKAFSAGSVIRYEVDYEYWLENGRTLKGTGFSVTVLPDPVSGLVPPDALITNVTVTSERLYFFVTATVVNETFTVQVQAADTLNEVVIDTVDFNVLPA